MNSTKLTFACYEGTASLASIKPLWDDLFSHCHNPAFYNDWRWHAGIQEHLVEADIAYVVASCADIPVAIVPLQRSARKHGPITASYLSLPFHVAIDLSDIVASKDLPADAFFQQLLSYLKSGFPLSWELLELRNFAESSTLYSTMRPYSQHLESDGESAFIRASADKNLLASVSSKQVKNAQRLARKAASSMGALASTEYCSGPELLAAYDAFLDVESASWKGDSGTKSAINLRPDAMAFYRQVLQGFGETAQAAVKLLTIDGQAAAAQMGIRVADRLHLLKIGFDERFSDVGPGGILLTQCLEQEDQNQTREVNLVTHPAWSFRWHCEIDPKHRVVFFNDTLLGRILSMSRKLLKLYKSKARKHT
ncbi:hypothetical protein R50072_05180 [Simiduia litorea]|uniref:GNAT family N-acetyltransferase n=1 Tax=Simiduia litorea TaxID=1435348 RepID=UPI0036F419E2